MIGLNELVPLSRVHIRIRYDPDDGFKNIGAWIDAAAATGVSLARPYGLAPFT